MAELAEAAAPKGLAWAVVDLGPLRRSRQFRRLWIGRTCSSFGSQMTLVAVMFQVWQSTHSTVWTGAVAPAQATPLIVFRRGRRSGGADVHPAPVAAVRRAAACCA